MRIRLIAEGKVKDGVFVDDVYGNIMWINPDGKTIKELEQQEDK